MSRLRDKFDDLFNSELTPVYENTKCKNCETVFSGRFCPQCGQSVDDFDKPFGFILFNFLGDFFAFDTRFFRTLKALIFKPGFLSSEFFQGKRAPYAPPLRVFIFSSFVMFLLLQWQTSRSFNESLYSLNGIENPILQDSLHSASQVETDTRNSIARDSDIAIDLNPVIFNNSGEMQKQLNGITEMLKKNMESTHDEKDKKELRKMIQTFSNPEMIINHILKLMSWMFFLLLPVFALILKLFYPRVKFIRHLIFSINAHSFIFIVLILIISLNLIIHADVGWISFLILLSVPVYLVIAMKNFFGQKIVAVLPRFLGITVLYNIVFSIVVLLVVLNAMLII